MRWEGREESRNVEDRRGRPARRRAPLGIGGLVGVLLVSYLLGADPRQLLSLLAGLESNVAPGPMNAPASSPDRPAADQAGRFHLAAGDLRGVALVRRHRCPIRVAAFEHHP